MKVVFVCRNPSIFVQYERVVRGLCARGHHVTFLLNSMEWRNADMDGRILEGFRKEAAGSFDFMPAPKGTSRGFKLLQLTRELTNYAAYVRKEHPVSTSAYMVDRAAQAMDAPFNVIARIRLFKMVFLRRRWGLGLMAALERCIAPDPGILSALKELAPDLVVASPFIFSRSEETEFIKAARALGQRTAAAIFSWDNLTSKGVFQVVPDAVLVWNRAQVKELEDIHKIPAPRALCTGAPSLDFWFEQKPRQSREEFCRQHGLNPAKPFVTYLCSSQTIARDEHVGVRQLVEFLQKDLGDRCPSILIRPHPLNLKIWDGFAMKDVMIVPRENKDIFYSSDARALFFETLRHGVCVLGLNTTAMIEASIVDRACVTLINDRYSLTQESSGHFHHLTDANILYSGRTFPEVRDRIMDLVEGRDPQAEARRTFVREFIRPWGVDRSSSQTMIRMLELLAAGTPADRVVSQWKAEGGTGA